MPNKSQKSLLRLMRPADFILAAAFLLIAAALALCFALSGGDAGSAVEIYSAGELLGTYDLDEDITLPLTENGFRNTVVIEQGRVRMESADCPDQHCVRHSAISRGGETIICLPARLVLTVLSDKGGELDAVVH